MIDFIVLYQFNELLCVYSCKGFLFKEEAKKFNLDVTKPARFGNGTYMTFAILKDGFDLAKNNNGTLNIEESFLLLEKLAKYIEHCVNKLRCV